MIVVLSLNRCLVILYIKYIEPQPVKKMSNLTALTLEPNIKRNSEMRRGSPKGYCVCSGSSGIWIFLQPFPLTIDSARIIYTALSPPVNNFRSKNRKDSTMQMKRKINNSLFFLRKFLFDCVFFFFDIKFLISLSLKKSDFS